MINFDRISESDISHAIGMADLDQAVAYLLGLAGIDGRISPRIQPESALAICDAVAGVLAQRDSSFDWKTADGFDREGAIRDWLLVEMYS